MNAITALPVDGAQLAAFFDAMFRYAERDTFLSLRAFYDDVSAVFSIQGRRVGDDPAAGLPAIEDMAARCALRSGPQCSVRRWRRSSVQTMRRKPLLPMASP